MAAVSFETMPIQPQSKRPSHKHFLKVHFSANFNTQQTIAFCCQIAGICKVVERIWIPDSCLYATFDIARQQSAKAVAKDWSIQNNVYTEVHKLEQKRQYRVTLMNLRWEVAISDFEEYLRKFVHNRTGKTIKNIQIQEKRTLMNQENLRARYCVIQFNENQEQYRNHMIYQLKSLDRNLSPCVWPELDPNFLNELVTVALAKD